MQQFDIAIIGAGPAGLAFARSLAGSGLSVALVEQQARQALAEPAFDGREIALTHASRQLLEQLGLWSRLDPADIARFGKDGAIVSMQPALVASEHATAEARLGPSRLAGAYAWKSIAAAGAHLAFGSDAPAAEPNPFAGIATAWLWQPAGGMAFFVLVALVWLVPDTRIERSVSG